ncbi:hypothetical protein HanIR_Chr03g0131791 [Helianthus annuus]|nr:hypothetical protein HanIR_Chr03g0131791 [Helianthus annuus]
MTVSQLDATRMSVQTCARKDARAPVSIARARAQKLPAFNRSAVTLQQRNCQGKRL